MYIFIYIYSMYTHITRGNQRKGGNLLVIKRDAEIYESSNETNPKEQ